MNFDKRFSFISVVVIWPSPSDSMTKLRESLRIQIPSRFGTWLLFGFVSLSYWQCSDKSHQNCSFIAWKWLWYWMEATLRWRSFLSKLPVEKVTFKIMTRQTMAFGKWRNRSHQLSCQRPMKNVVVFQEFYGKGALFCCWETNLTGSGLLILQQLPEMC